MTRSRAKAPAGAPIVASTRASRSSRLWTTSGAFAPTTPPAAISCRHSSRGSCRSRYLSSVSRSNCVGMIIIASYRTDSGSGARPRPPSWRSTGDPHEDTASVQSQKVSRIPDMPLRVCRLCYANDGTRAHNVPPFPQVGLLLQSPTALFGSPATSSKRPIGFAPRLAAGLPFSQRFSGRRGAYVTLNMTIENTDVKSGGETLGKCLPPIELRPLLGYFMFDAYLLV